MDTAIGQLPKSLDTLFNNAGVADTLRLPVSNRHPAASRFPQTMTDKVIDWCVKESGGRLVTPREVAASLAWLGSPASPFVNGVNLNIDNGFTAGTITGQIDFSELMGA